MHEVIKTFMIPDDDLSRLEKCIPVLHEVCSSMPEAYMRADVQLAIEECKRILSDVRWGYGPFREISKVNG
jgi:hypothetical protein